MPRSIDEVQVVGDAVPGRIEHPDGVQLDRDATLPLQFVGIQHLVAHRAGVQRPGRLEQAIRKGGLPVIDVRYDAEVADGRSAHDERVRGSIRSRPPS